MLEGAFQSFNDLGTYALIQRVSNKNLRRKTQKSQQSILEKTNTHSTEEAAYLKQKQEEIPRTSQKKKQKKTYTLNVNYKFYALNNVENMII